MTMLNSVDLNRRAKRHVPSMITPLLKKVGVAFGYPDNLSKGFIREFAALAPSWTLQGVSRIHGCERTYAWKIELSLRVRFRFSSKSNKFCQPRAHENH